MPRRTARGASPTMRLRPLEHLWQTFELEAARQLDTVLAGVPPLHGREVDARRLGRDVTLFDERTHEAHAEPLLLELRPERRIGIKGPIGLRAHGLLTEGEPRLDAGVGAPTSVSYTHLTLPTNLRV